MVDISKKTLEKIKKEHVQPIPRWFFMTRNYFFWLVFILTTFLGGIAFGMILFLAGDLDWDIYHYLGLSLPQAVAIGLPYLWIVLLFLFLLISYYHFTHTRTGYRYRFIIIFFLSLVVSGLLGMTFYQYGWTETVERQLRTRIPGYQRMVYNGKKQWMNPQKGLLNGKITGIDSKKEILWLEDYNGKRWNIDTSQTKFRTNLALNKDLEIKIIGQQLSKTNFVATEIRIPQGYHQGKGRSQ